jgi:hypothetical protein
MAMSFDLLGRDEDGVISFVGLESAPPQGDWLAVLGVGIVLLAALLFGGVAAALHGRPLVFALCLFTDFLLCRLFIMGTLWWLRVCRRIGSLVSLLELSEMLGVAQSFVAVAARQNGVRPVYRVNSVDLFDPAEFDAASLVRAANTPDSLLRGAQGAGTAHALPRPADPSLAV